MTRKRVVLAIGLILIAAGFGLNPPVVGYLLFGSTADSHWVRRYLVLMVDAGLLVTGLCVLAYAKWTTGTLADDLRTAIRRHPRKTSAALGILLTVFLYGTVEVGFFIYNKSGPQLRVGRSGTHLKNYLTDALLGFSHIKNNRATYRKTENDRILFDTVYHTDDAGRRITPASQAERTDAPVLFFGCSFTFGIGVNDDETMPNQFALAAPRHPVINCAVGGYGPQQMLALAESDRLDHLIQNKSIIAVYTFIDDHVRRVIGGMRVVTKWGGNMPYYLLNDQDQPARIGEFVRDRPIRSVIYAFTEQSQILKTFNVDLPPRLAESDFHLTARIVEESKRRLAAKTENCRFYFVFYPGCRFVRELTAQFKDPNVNLLDYSNLFPWPDPMYKIQGDLHPTPLAHRRLAQQLAEDILPH